MLSSTDVRSGTRKSARLTTVWLQVAEVVAYH